MIHKWSLAVLGSVCVGVLFCPGCAGGIGEDWHAPTRLVTVQDHQRKRFVDGPYTVQFRVTNGLSESGESWALLTAPAEGHVVLPVASAEWYQQVHQSNGPSLFDFRLDLDYRVDEWGVLTAQLEIDRYHPYRGHWSKRIQGRLQEPITIVLETPEQMPVTMQLRVSKVADCGENEVG